MNQKKINLRDESELADSPLKTDINQKNRSLIRVDEIREPL